MNKDHLVSVYCGGAKRNIIKLSEWEQESTNYFNRFFSERSNGIICVPQHGDAVMATLKEWCKATQKSHSQGALIVQNFDLSKQLKFLRIQRKSAERESIINHSIAHNQSRYLAYNCSENVILYLWRGKNGKEKENLAEEIRLCVSEIHILMHLYQDDLRESGVKIIGLVISNTEIQNFNLKCELCKIFVVSVAIFENFDSFCPWWKEIDRWFNSFSSYLYQINDESFSSFSAKMLSLMACTDCSHLPNFTKSVASQIDELCLLLNPEQMDIIYSSNNYTILKGNFGTGKSIVMQKKLEILIGKIEKDEVIYYINYDHKSNAFIGTKSFIKKISPKNLNKIKIWGNRDGLKLSGIFRNVLREVEKGLKRVHIFIDEFNGEDLTHIEVERLKSNLQEKYFKNAVVFIAAQPIERERIDTFGYSSEMLKSEANLFSELEDTFKIEELTYVMRTTVQINTIVELVQKSLENKQNTFIHHQSGNKPIFIPPISTILNSQEPSQNLFTLPENESPENLDFSLRNNHEDQAQNKKTEPLSDKDSGSSQKNLADSHENMSELDGENTTNLDTPNLSSPGKTPGKSLNLSTKRSKVAFIHGIYDLDQAFKEAGKFEGGHNENGTTLKTISSYKFISESYIGHRIVASNPKVIVPGVFDSEFENILSHSAVLNSLGIGRQKVVITHFEQSTPSIFKKALSILSVPFLCNVQQFVRDKKSKTLITNFQYVRGMEFENVVIVLDPEEYFLKQYLPEAITRCTNNLAMIMLEDKKLKGKEDTVKGVVELLEQKEPPVVEKWITRKCKKCGKHSSYYCQKNDGNIKCIGINTSSSKFKEMQNHFNSSSTVPADEDFTVSDTEHV